MQAIIAVYLSHINLLKTFYRMPETITQIDRLSTLKDYEEEVWQCKWSPTLGELEATHQEVWGTKEYQWNNKPTVFMGIYSMNDVWALWGHRGRKAVLWCGGDLLRLTKTGYWLDTNDALRVDSKVL